MIDIHTHILPETDDGARSMDEAVQMARLAVADGTTHVFATPHHRAFGPLARDEVFRRVETLQVELDRHRIPLTVLPGHEVRLEDGLEEEWRRGLAGPLADSRYVLAEPPFDCYDELVEARLLRLIDEGYAPIMAHPERILPIQEDLSLLEPFLARGGLLQISAASVLGRGTSRDRVTAETLLHNGMAHYLASDAHSTFGRPPVLSGARDRVARIVGREAASWLVQAHPVSILLDSARTA